MTTKFFLLALQHGYVGNSHLWWRPKGSGYTCDLNQAGLYSREDLKDITLGYDTHAVPEAEARASVEHHVTDTKGLMKYHAARRKNAPKPPPRKPRKPDRCCDCGVFMKPLTSPEGSCRKCMDKAYP